MICEECRKQGLKSKVFIGMQTCTAMYSDSYYDEDGNYHFHDPNITTTVYSCSNDHTWTVKTSGRRCPVSDCEWNKDRSPG
jgi:hypothetical protein